MAEDLSFILERLRAPPFGMKELSVYSLRFAPFLNESSSLLLLVRALLREPLRLHSLLDLLLHLAFHKGPKPDQTRISRRSEKTGDTLLQLLSDVVGRVSPGVRLLVRVSLESSVLCSLLTSRNRTGSGCPERDSGGGRCALDRLSEECEIHFPG